MSFMTPEEIDKRMDVLGSRLAEKGQEKQKREIGPRAREGRQEIERVKMREIALILSVLGTLVLFFVPVRLSIAESMTDWNEVFPSWRKWLAIGTLLSTLGVPLLLSH